MSERYLLPRNSLLWMVTAQGLAIVPLLWQLPLWLTGVWGLVLFWRLQEFRGHWPMPGRWIKALLVAVSVAGLFASFGRFLGLEPMVAMLICALLLKQLEMQRRKDALLLSYLTFFLIGVQFLFSQTLLASVYGVVCLWCALCSLLSMNQPVGHLYPGRSLKLAGRLLLHTIPLMILLFLVMPRIGSLWSVPSPSQSAKTGVSDRMSPGDFSRLSRSGGVAFRVEFDHEIPPADQLYWRGLVFSRFDGRTWQQAQRWQNRDGPSVMWQGDSSPAWRQQARGQGDTLSYSIILEPTHQRWLFSLTLPVEFERGKDFGLARDYRLLRRQPIHQRLQYSVTSQLDYTLEAEPMPEWRLQQELQLPGGFNPQSLRQARQWRGEADSEQAYIERVLQHFRDRFTYTLEPPLLGDHSVDEFLWQTQQGFCEHFASSFVVMMRAAGIPARVVAGYLGGEYNELENYLVVHQYDAHAWAEVWIPGRGWVRVDPTAAVAPERIRQSLGEWQTSLVEETVSLGRYRHLPLVASLRMRWDAWNYRWHKVVIGFDRDAQSDLLENLLGGVSPLKLVLFVLLGGGAVIGMMMAHLWWQSRPEPVTRAVREFRRVERLLKRLGWVRGAGETPRDFAGRISERQTELALPLQGFTALFERQQYSGEAVAAEEWVQALKSIRRALRNLKYPNLPGREKRRSQA